MKSNIIWLFETAQPFELESAIQCHPRSGLQALNTHYRVDIRLFRLCQCGYPCLFRAERWSEKVQSSRRSVKRKA